MLEINKKKFNIKYFNFSKNMYNVFLIKRIMTIIAFISAILVFLGSK